MMTSENTDCYPLPELPGCGSPAVHRIEIYSPRDGRAHGSLDASRYVCAEHSAPVVSALYDAGLTPYQCSSVPSRAQRCGDGFDFRSKFPTTGAADTAPVTDPDDKEANRCFTLLDADDWTEVERDDVLFDRPAYPEIVITRFAFPTGAAYEVIMDADLENPQDETPPEDLSCIPKGARLVQEGEVMFAGAERVLLRFWEPALTS